MLVRKVVMVISSICFCSTFIAADDSTITISTHENLYSIDANDAHLGKVLSGLARASGNQLVIHGECSLKVNTSLSNVSFDDALYVLLKGNEFTYIKKNNLYIVADECLDTLMYTHLVGNELYSMYRSHEDTGVHFDSYLFNRIPIPIKNNDMMTDDFYLLKHVKAEQAAAVLPEKMRKESITIDKEKNALLIHGTMEDIHRVTNALKSIDLPRKQIRMDVLMVEFNENLNNDVGVEMGINTSPADRPDVNIPVTVEGAGNTFSGKTPFGTLDFLGDRFYARLEMMIRDGKANVLAKPSISVINGHEAVVEVDNVSYYKVESGDGEEHVSQFQPINYGIRLKIIPTLTGNATINAIIEPEISNRVSFNNEGYPDISRRKVRSTVQMLDGKTLVLGGLVRQEEAVSDSKVPFLGDIPILGVLFKRRTKHFNRTNLCVFITPHIVEEDSNISTEKYEKKLETGKYRRMYEDLKNQKNIR